MILKAFRRRRHPNVFRGVVTGITAGIAATLIMDQFQKLGSSGRKTTKKRLHLVQHEPEETMERSPQQQEETVVQEGSTEKVARRIAEATGKELAPEEKRKAGQAVHYAFGTLMGAVYGVTAELIPEVTTGGGTAYGTSLPRCRRGRSSCLPARTLIC